jgi:hypothetical protein
VKQRQDGEVWEQFAVEIIIDPDGSLQIPWFNPAVTGLVVDIWQACMPGQEFPVGRKNGNIYCG